MQMMLGILRRSRSDQQLKYKKKLVRLLNAPASLR